MIQRIVWVIFSMLALSPVSYADQPADTRAIELAAQAWIDALNEHDTDEMVQLATEDVVLMDATQPPIVGRDAARAAWQRSLPAAGTRITTTTKQVEVAGNIAWRIGALVHERAGGELLSRGQSLEIWKRVNGEWKLHRQMSSSLLARQPLLRRPLPTDRVLDAPREKN